MPLKLVIVMAPSYHISMQPASIGWHGRLYSGVVGMIWCMSVAKSLSVVTWTANIVGPGWPSAGVWSDVEGSGFRPLVVVGSSVRTPRTSQGPGGFCCCLELVIGLSASGTAFNGLGRPGFEARVNISLANTLVVGTTVISTDTDTLAGASATSC